MMRTWKMISAMTTAALLCATAAHAQPRYNGFSVVLLLGEAQGSGTGDGLPPAAGLRKALADVKDFLPYKSYKVLDTQWLRSGMTRMKGPDDQEYDVEVNDVDLVIPNPVPRASGMVRVAFKLQEVGAPMNSSEEYGRSIQVADMEKQIENIQRRISEGASGPQVPELMAAKNRLSRQIRLARAHKLVDTQFEMAPGETVVVGTSKIGGDKGLVVLLTAVAAGGK
jgi:hypothetical protein